MKPNLMMLMSPGISQPTLRCCFTTLPKRSYVYSFAHVGLPSCPWFELTTETNFASFKRRVDDEMLGTPLRSAALKSEAGRVFLGRSDPEAGGDPAEWERATRHLVEFVGVLAERGSRMLVCITP
ncbi:MAG: hypothetical protein LC808_07655 [Actinobacteria bacterium]|nr:hypothetical protein [Actinomycetota bacterium]